MLDVDAKALIEVLKANNVLPSFKLTPEAARRVMLDGRFKSQPEAQAVASTSDFFVANSDGTTVKLRSYRPAGTHATDVLPALVYLHGGGWTLGDLDTHDVLCRELCNLGGFAVVAVDYRRGPEHPFPGAVQDALAAYQHVRDNAESLCLDSERIAVGGDSSGGNLAAVICLTLRDLAQAQPAFQLLIYPSTEQQAQSESHRTNAQGYLFTADSVKYYRGHYLPDTNDYADWRASPLLAADHSLLAPALVVTAGFDPLHDEGLAYADMLSNAGTRSQTVCFERQIHGFITMGRIIDEANTAVALCALVVRRALAKKTSS